MSDASWKLPFALGFLERSLEEFIEVEFRQEFGEDWHLFLPKGAGPGPRVKDLLCLVRQHWMQLFRSTAIARQGADVTRAVLDRLRTVSIQCVANEPLSASLVKRALFNVKFILENIDSPDLASMHILMYAGSEGQFLADVRPEWVCTMSPRGEKAVATHYQPGDATAARQRAGNTARVARSSVATTARSPAQTEGSTPTPTDFLWPLPPMTTAPVAPRTKTAAAEQVPTGASTNRSTLPKKRGRTVEIESSGRRTTPTFLDESLQPVPASLPVENGAGLQDNDEDMMDVDQTGGKPISFVDQMLLTSSPQPSLSSTGLTAPHVEDRPAHDASGSDVLDAPAQRALFVLDGPNVAHRHGLGRFSSRGILCAHSFFVRNGHECVVVLPDGKLSLQMLSEVDSSMVDEQNEVTVALRRLLKMGKIILTPSEDYDDSYVLMYAMSRGGIAVSNDRYKDHVVQWSARGPHFVSLLEDYLKRCRLSFAFRGDEFIPSPDFNLQAARTTAQTCARRFVEVMQGTGFALR